jgi:ABC-type polysaccharide/polyol phosphate export permease
MDLQLRYRRSMLGIGWSLLHPLANTLVLCLAFHEIFQTPVRIYVPYLMSGFAWWGFISGVTTRGCGCFVEAESFIRQHPVPMAIYPLRAALGTMIHLVIALGVVLAMVWSFHGFGNLPGLAFLPVSLVLLLVFGWSVAVLAGYVNSVFRDIQHFCDIAFQVIFYLTPIIYPPNSQPERLAQVFRYNPLVPLLRMVREPLLEGRVPAPETIANAAAITLVVATGAVLFLGRVQKRVVLYL